MDWTAHVDNYCERTGPELGSEPLNLVTNALFVVAAVLAYRRYRRVGRRDRGIEVMLALLVVIGIGSGLFHSVATRWAMVADVAPIGVLVVIYLGYFLRYVVALAPRRVVLGLAAFFAISVLLALIPRAWSNNSQSYFGTFATMVAVAVATWHTVGRRLAGPTALFAVSLTLRAIDLAVCDAVPIGTHFLWHTCNAILIYLLLAIVIDRNRADTPVSG